MEDGRLDHGALARELLRALRGTRSREAFARRLGASANAIYAWESGRRIPSADLLFHAADRDGVDVAASLRRFFEGEEDLGAIDPRDRLLPGRVLAALRGSATVSDLARRAGVERTALSRWLSGAAVPRLPELLAVLDASGARLVDFVSIFVDPGLLPSMEAPWRRLRAARRLIAEHPWASPLLVALELDAVVAAPAHPPGFVGATVGIDAETEQRCLALLAEAGLATREGDRWVSPPHPHVALHAPSARRAARAWAAREAASRIESDAPGSFGFLVAAISREDEARLLEARQRFVDEIKRSILHPSGRDRVVVLNLHIFGLGRE